MISLKRRSTSGCRAQAFSELVPCAPESNEVEFPRVLELGLTKDASK